MDGRDRARSYQRALRDLRDRHPEEFQELLVKHGYAFPVPASCTICGKDYRPRNSRQKTCGDPSCQQALERRRHGGPYVRLCHYCQDPLITHDRYQRSCADCLDKRRKPASA